ncbi:hypothetical protein CYMTET_36351 [Cymbomonas tetramitiformis]|uniref:Uncharacterized protein n=1 Tax=Cymbomonas tetramitiformis TaxID=36881 RepID=A0AAE0CHD9_9CHLO|nr:hypothetical protein CYMTET_36351 [Cymbomonas tetramitiformis]
MLCGVVLGKNRKFGDVAQTEDARKAAVDVCKEESIGCKGPADEEGGDPAVLACYGWADAFYYPAVAFEATEGANPNSSLFDRVVKHFVEHNVFHETAVRTIGHILAGALPKGDNEDGLAEVRCFGGCCSGNAQDQDLFDWTCGHKFGLHVMSNTDSLVAMLSGGKNNASKRPLGGRYYASKSLTI